MKLQRGGRGSAKSELINNILRAKIMQRMLSGVSQLALMGWRIEP